MLVKYRQNGILMVLVILKFVTYLYLSELSHDLSRGTDGLCKPWRKGLGTVENKKQRKLISCLLPFDWFWSVMEFYGTHNFNDDGNILQGKKMICHVFNQVCNNTQRCDLLHLHNGEGRWKGRNRENNVKLKHTQNC